MRDDLPRLLAPPTLPNGLPNPAHLEKVDYLARARAAASDVARANDVGAARLQVSFPDAGVVRASPGQGRRDRQSRAERTGSRAGSADVEASAVAEAAAPAGGGTGSMPATASGGGYSGPLVYRTGEGMRPDVAAAFDRMAAAASRAGLTLVVNSGFRSDAEQAALFAAHPDPTWVAPPGHSLHRCATELDLGPESAYGWLAANASRFGFVQRYSWEAWHYGFTAGPVAMLGGGECRRVGGVEQRRRGRRCLCRRQPAFPPSSPRASARRSCARGRAGTSPPPCSRPS